MTAAGCTSPGTARRWVWQLDIWPQRRALPGASSGKGEIRPHPEQDRRTRVSGINSGFFFWRATSISQRPNQGDLSLLASRWRFAGNCRLAMSSAGFSSVTSDSWQRRRSVVPAAATPRKPRTRSTHPSSLHIRIPSSPSITSL